VRSDRRLSFDLIKVLRGFHEKWLLGPVQLGDHVGEALLETRIVAQRLANGVYQGNEL